MKFKPSKYQQAIYDHVQHGEGNAIVDAVAGSGKSTTIIESLKLIDEDQSVLFLAFNKAIVEELKIKVGFQENVEVKTLHSLGAQAIMNMVKCKINGDKYKAYLNEGIKNQTLVPEGDLDYEEFSMYKSNIIRLIDLVRVDLCSSVDQFEGLAEKHNLELVDNEIEIVAKVARWGFKNMDEIDFTDMIYFPNKKKIPMRKYDWVFIDECQDLNAAQRELFLKCIKPGGRFVAVGDPRQAIYGFAGADVESFELLKQIDNTVELPLSVCYRCDSEIINIAKEIVPQIEVKDNAEAGVVDHNAKVKDVQDGDMILCRVTAPLAKLCMQYIIDGVKAHIKGRDVGMNLINMLNRTKKTNILEAQRVLNRELDKIAIKVSEKQNCGLAEARESSIYSNYADKVTAIEVLSEGLMQTRQLVSRIESIFNDSNTQGICLSTIHKSKGLEADRVFIACPETLLHKKSMQVEWMREQEHNLVYVAYTRAKHHLGFIQDFSI